VRIQLTSKLVITKNYINNNDKQDLININHENDYLLRCKEKSRVGIDEKHDMDARLFSLK